jgi:hypothetical protein
MFVTEVLNWGLMLTPSLALGKLKENSWKHSAELGGNSPSLLSTSYVRQYICCNVQIDAIVHCCAMYAHALTEIHLCTCAFLVSMRW